VHRELVAVLAVLVGVLEDVDSAERKEDAEAPDAALFERRIEIVGFRQRAWVEGDRLIFEDDGEFVVGEFHVNGNVALQAVLLVAVQDHVRGNLVDGEREETGEFDDVFSHVMPEDLLKFGMIPEFIGRLPVFTSVTQLDRDALVQVLTEPKNALVKQYQRLFEIDGVELEFAQDALDQIADLALLRGTGARGLRAILEEVLLNVMYDVPGREDVAKVVITGEVVKDNVNPTIVPRDIDAPERREKSA